VYAPAWPSKSSSMFKVVLMHTVMLS
jgi:hypothetical protein